VTTPDYNVKASRRVLGRTGLSVSEIGFGCGPTASLIAAGQRDAQRAAVLRALELGIDYFDTAPLYGAGESERVLGQLLRELRATPRVATKVALADSDFSDVRGAILRSVDASLTRLGQPHVTVLHLHNRIAMQRAANPELGVDTLLSVDDVLGSGGVAETFETLRAQGVVELFGCSAYGGDMRAVEQIVDSGSFDCLHVHYSLLNSTAWDQPSECVEAPDYQGIGARAAAAGLGVVALRVLEAGLLTERLSSASAAVTRDGEARRARAVSLAARLGPASLAQTALRFALSRPEVTTVLVGFSDVAQVEDAVASAAKGSLPQTLLSEIEAWRTEGI
jgi:L-galactose dehydrogenase/L-glyceraldehyde 3-phosphate reductase